MQNGKMISLFSSECLCMSETYVCEAYGGQCECDEVSQMGFSSRIGRQCELCPLYTHHSINGCTGTSIIMTPLLLLKAELNYSLYLSRRV